MEAEFNQSRDAAIEKIKGPNQLRNGFISEEQLSSVLFASQLNSRVEITKNAQALMTSRNICDNFSYETFLNRIMSSANSDELLNADFFQQKRAFSTAFTFFWTQFPKKIEGLQREISDAVFTNGDSCSTKLRVGLTSACKTKIAPRISGWYSESDLNREGCNLGRQLVDVQSYVRPRDDLYFPGAFYILQLASKPGGFPFVRVTHFLPAPALNALLLNEFVISEQERTTSGDFFSVLESLSSKAGQITATLRTEWLSKLDSDVGYKKLAAAYVALSTQMESQD
jgi:hypothetical protein